MNVYKSIEKHFFNSLTKKIVGNVLSLLIPHIILMVLAYYHASEIENVISAIEMSEPELALLENALGAFWLSGVVTVVYALISGVFTIFFMRHLFLKPIEDVTTILRAIKEKDGDISATLPVYTFDEISTMSKSYNGFSTKLKEIIADTRSRSVNVALSAARLKQIISQAYDKATEQEERAYQVFQSSTQSTQAIDDIARSTMQISENNSSNLDDVRASRSELLKVQEQIEAIRRLVCDFQATVQGLQSNSYETPQLFYFYLSCLCARTLQ